ncbi:Aste57867_22763 [Aphanomyces stellatus]|uniref:Aste57867_22763 protein n=1 Tax=Aphanomyces stellatus TaxID=120398 RepID=A0A485LM29_9STRA|nr:hypothetical protein As57867_022693 [Aphanomyces stellatus]VFT99416.1 Aste57867_22763 [Aphanomyces stellatus]
MPGAKKRLTLQQKAIIRDHYKMVNPNTINELSQWVVQQFGFAPHRTTLQRIVNDQRGHDHIAECTLATRYNVQLPKCPELEIELYKWIIMANSKQCSITSTIIVRKAETLAKEMGLGDALRFSKGWLHRFQQRFSLHMFQLHGEAASADPKIVEDGREVLAAHTSLYDLECIYNMDETGVMYNYQPNTTISNAPRSGSKKDKSRISVVLASNADGSHKLPLTFIGKSKKPRCFGNMNQSAMAYLYRSNRKAWMTIALFAEWIQQLNDSMKCADKQILLILDNASSHKYVDVDLTNVRVFMLPPNTTAWLQPMDAGIIAAFKRYYKRRQVDHVIKTMECRTVESLPAKNLYGVDVLTAMEWLKESWDEVSSITIRNCWKHTGIVPCQTLASQFGALRLAPVSSIRQILS